MTPSNSTSKDENQSSNKSKKGLPKPLDHQTLNCPRCNSTNTKFCYYNNYNLNQPRHFCKTCRRYWTKGGALRNVPIGGGCRRNKKVKSSEINEGLKIFNGFSPAMDFQLGNCSNLMGFNYTENQEMGLVNNVVHGNNNLVSSIESLSYINQDLHLKFQQQRLAMLENQSQKIQPILFQNLETSKSDGLNGGDGVTEWYFGNSYAPLSVNLSDHGNGNGNGNGNVNDNSIIWGNGVDLHHYRGLP